MPIRKQLRLSKKVAARQGSVQMPISDMPREGDCRSGQK